MLVVVPINGHSYKAEYELIKTVIKGCKDAQVVPCGAFIASTTIVIIMANTPSLKASNLPFPVTNYSGLGDKKDL